MGQPNQKLSTAAEWRYGKKGSLAIKMSGDKKGLWHNFETGESGNLISLIKKETGLTFKETLKYAINMSGIPLSKNDQYELTTINEKSADKTKSSAINKTSDYAITLAKESLSIQGTIAEKYLKEIRRIENIDCQDIRYHPKVYTGKGEKQKYLPAMLSIGRDKDGQVKCVQATYLDPKTANKADLDIQKRTYASPAEAAVTLQKSSDKDKTSYIAEGVETGLSIKDAIKNGDVIATLGKSNFTSLDPSKLGQKVVFCLDNDGKSTNKDEVINKVAQRLIGAGKKVFISIPNQINNQKTDFNDVTRINGRTKVKEYLDNIKSYNMLDNTTRSISILYKNNENIIKNSTQNTIQNNEYNNNNQQKMLEVEINAGNSIHNNTQNFKQLNQKIETQTKQIGWFERDF